MDIVYGTPSAINRVLLSLRKKKQVRLCEEGGKFLGNVAFDGSLDHAALLIIKAPIQNFLELCRLLLWL